MQIEGSTGGSSCCFAHLPTHCCKGLGKWAVLEKAQFFSRLHGNSLDLARIDKIECCLHSTLRLETLLLMPAGVVVGCSKRLKKSFLPLSVASISCCCCSCRQPQITSCPGGISSLSSDSRICCCSMCVRCSMSNRKSDKGWIVLCYNLWEGRNYCKLHIAYYTQTINNYSRNQK